MKRRDLGLLAILGSAACVDRGSRPTDDDEDMRCEVHGPISRDKFVALPIRDRDGGFPFGIPEVFRVALPAGQGEKVKATMPICTYCVAVALADVCGNNIRPKEGTDIA
jgi:hypothetical protein